MNVAAADKNIQIELKGFKESYKMESSLKHVTYK
jgi:hypothetical protein